MLIFDRSAARSAYRLALTVWLCLSATTTVSATQVDTQRELIPTNPPAYEPTKTANVQPTLPSELRSYPQRLVDDMTITKLGELGPSRRLKTGLRRIDRFESTYKKFRHIVKYSAKEADERGWIEDTLEPFTNTEMLTLVRTELDCLISIYLDWIKATQARMGDDILPSPGEKFNEFFEITDGHMFSFHLANPEDILDLSHIPTMGPWVDVGTLPRDQLLRLSPLVYTAIRGEIDVLISFVRHFTVLINKPEVMDSVIEVGHPSYLLIAQLWVILKQYQESDYYPTMEGSVFQALGELFVYTIIPRIAAALIYAGHYTKLTQLLKNIDRRFQSSSRIQAISIALQAQKSGYVQFIRQTLSEDPGLNPRGIQHCLHSLDDPSMLQHYLEMVHDLIPPPSYDESIEWRARPSRRDNGSTCPLPFKAQLRETRFSNGNLYISVPNYKGGNTGKF
ncbi:hypothetical protein H4R33_005919 [Dimargaris cristalligena]|uniref:Uncharacterized protein n=1 Tax=Dimargaris cristalligena TaxID=215637 RepID=A0A4P9ZPR6_9FUNG|nr:hypothetical protein H4R33_005919 [Dimargaris cristalligena]RKP35436.1 hypothetical protein BJ085DRAFT_34733 [Dimargaris cristalligena]|eukprot:RKP35436.1 hypothetical protein BJ085DRAFT_34733 [Dimargaris cristalligena]